MLLFTLLASSAADRAAAQAADNGREEAGLAWDAEEMRAGFCIHFLVDPAMKAALPFGNAPLATAGEAQGLHTSVSTLVAGSPEHSTWSPSSLCLFQYATVNTPSGVVSDRSDPQGFLVWSSPAATAGSPAPAEIFVTSGRLARQSGQPQVSIGRFELKRAPVPETTKEEVVLEIGKTVLTWQGRMGSDSTATGAPTETVWRIGGTQGSTWTARARIATRTERAMIGALRVEGKGELATMLGASPIRFAGPVGIGGEGRVAFSR